MGKCIKSAIDEAKKKKIRDLHAQGVPQPSIAERYGIARSTVSKITREGKTA